VSAPKFRQLESAIRARIESGEYAAGDPIPSEHELAREFGISRPTVVRALENLRRDGWIYTRQGKGSFAWRPGARKIDLGPGDEAVIAVHDATGTPVLVVEVHSDPRHC
jgi:GntR family transcriptional regulator